MRLLTIITSLALASVTVAVPVAKAYPAAAPVAAPKGANVRDGVYISCNKPGEFALTFDDGPYQYSWDLAKSLNKQGIKATFFINGNNWVNVETDKVKTSEGQKTYMQVIKHFKDYEHKELAGLSAAEIKYQMNTQSDIIKKAIGVRPAYMRPPAGNFDQNTLKVLRSLGYHVVDWDVDTNDWRNHNFAEEQAAYKTMNKDKPTTLGHITLEHEVYAQTVNELVPWAINFVKSKKYKFVTVSECIGFPAYYQ